MFYFLTLLMAGISYQNPNHWQTQVMFGEIGVCMLTSIEVLKKFGSLAAISFLYFSSFSVFSQFGITQFSLPYHNLQQDYDIATARACLYLLFSLVPFIFSTSIQIQSAFKAFVLFALVDSLIMIYHFISNGSATGMIGMDSVDGTFLAIFLPLLLTFPIVLAPVIFAIIFSHSSTVFGVLILELIVYLFFEIKNKANALIVCSSIGLSSIPIGMIYLGNQLFQSNGRSLILKKMFKVFESIPHSFMGLGTSSFQVIMPLFQNTSVPYFVWLHNEPLQVLFDQGIIGLILMTGLYVKLLWNNKGLRSRKLFISLCGMGFQSFFQPCFRFFIFAFFLSFLTRLGFENFDDVNYSFN